MITLILIAILGLIGFKFVADIVRGHAENLSNPETHNITVAFWLFTTLFVWTIIAKGDHDSVFQGGSIWYWTYVMIASPLFCVYAWKTIKGL